MSRVSQQKSLLKRISLLTWIIHEPSLLQMRGIGPCCCTSVPQMGHNKASTPPTQQYRFARRVKNVDENKKILLEKFYQQCQDNFLILLK